MLHSKFRGKLLFQVSGFNTKEKQEIHKLIASLQTSVNKDNAFCPSCTHLIVKKPCRSEKFLSAIANGLFVLRESYIRASAAHGYWLDEEQFLWSSGSTDQDVPTELVMAARRSRERLRCTGQKALTGWICAVLTSDSERSAVYKRILQYGGAEVRELTMPVTSTRHIPTNLTHVFTETRYKHALQVVARQGVHCVTPEYIGDFLIKGEVPQPAHYIIPFHVTTDSLSRVTSDHPADNVACCYAEERSPEARVTQDDEEKLHGCDISLKRDFSGTDLQSPNKKLKADSQPPITATGDTLDFCDEDIHCLDKWAQLLSLEERHTIHQQHSEYLEKQMLFQKSQLGQDQPQQHLNPLPLLLTKQIETHFEDNFKEECMNGLDLLESSLSATHYPPWTTLQKLYSTLVEAEPGDLALQCFNYLMAVLSFHPPHKSFLLDGRSVHMRVVYLKALERVTDDCRTTYLYELKQAVQRIAQKAAADPSCYEEWSDGDNSKSSEYCTMCGAQLYIQYLTKLILADKGGCDRMLVSMFQSHVGSAVQICIDRGDSRIFCRCLTQLFQLKDYRSARCMLKVVNRVAEYCCGRGGSAVNLNVAVSNVVSYLADTLNGVDTNTLDSLLNSLLPPWLALHVCLYTLDGEAYDNCLSDKLTLQNIPELTLHSLISKYLFLVPRQRDELDVKKRGCFSQVTGTPIKSKRNMKGETALHIACIKNNLEKVLLLVQDPGTDLNAKDYAGWTALHEACNHGHLAVVEALLKHGTAARVGPHRLDLMSSGLDGITPLHDAVQNGHYEVVQLLLKYGGRRLLAAKNLAGQVAGDLTKDARMMNILVQALSQPETATDNAPRLTAPGDVIYDELGVNAICDTISCERYGILALDTLSLYIATRCLTKQDMETLMCMNVHLSQFLVHIKRICHGGVVPRVLFSKIAALHLLCP